MTKMNILFMQSQEYFGADTMIHSLLMRYLDRNTCNVHIACNPGTPQQPSASIKVLSEIPKIYLRPTLFGTSVHYRSKSEIIRDTIRTSIPSFFSLAGLVQYVRSQRIDVIHCTEKPRDAFFGSLIAKLTGARYVVHLHVKAENWIRPQVRWAMKRADGLIAVSSFVADSIIDLGFAAEKIHVVLNSLDLSRWNNQLDGGLDSRGWNDQNSGSEVRREFGVSPHMPLLAIVSRVNPWKGHTELLKALAIVKARGMDFRLLLVGVDDPRATPGGGSYLAELKQLTQELDLADQIIFTGFRRDVPQIMSACDIYSMPSFEEPFGVVYLEAMAMRKPVIALDNGGAREIVEHGKSGLLSLPQDIEHLARNIETLINDPDLRKQMGSYGRRQVEERFTPQAMSRDAEQVYRKVIQT
jgi:glycosyltransferase involved in cell wall biosynthesis